jgi:hypothetical protein
MKRNMGTWDRVSRFFAGGAMIGIGIAGGFNPQLLILGGVAAFTGLVGFCPVYVPFAFDTLDAVKNDKVLKPASRRKAA